jgi:DNA-directed RNA polymerase specialized sigma24 family protein
MTPGILEPEKFEKLLDWLDPDRETAGQRYESIRARLIRIFYSRGCYQAEEMADETMDRVVRKIDTLFGIYEGDPALYFYAVARNVFLEFSRIPRHSELPENLSAISSVSEDTEEDSYYDCLEKCLEKLPEGQREFIVEFHRYTKAAKIECRKKMALAQSITAQALRIRAFRVRGVLRKCISQCITNKNDNVTF